MELKILDFIQTLRNPILDKMMLLFTSLGNGGIIWLLLVVILVCIPKTRKTGVMVMLALALDVLLCSGLLKHLFARIRPCDVNTSIQLLIPRPTDYSFPSGHTSVSFSVVAALYLAKEKKLFIPSLLIAILISFSRMYLYVHYPTDILGGIVLGILCGYLSYIAVDKFIVKKIAL